VLLDEAKKININALLGPHIKTLQQWVTTENPSSSEQPVNDYCRELILYDALTQHPNLYGKGNPWTLTNELLQLFDELTLGNTQLPKNLHEFEKLLSQAYGIKEATLIALGNEANIVHTLWHAWHEQLKAKNRVDKITDYVISLANSSIDKVDSIYFVGFYDFKKIESSWINSIHTQNNFQLILHGEDNPLLLTNRESNQAPKRQAEQQKINTTSYIECLNTIFTTTDYKNNSNRQTLKTRAESFSSQYPQSPLNDVLSVFTANNSEDEALAIDIQVRSWLLQGKKNIGIITENRRLARRVRAVLERANIVINDYSGWALSTSSAASVVERWFQVIENDFAHEPLLDILKSPFIFPDWDTDERLLAVFRLENDIILHENISSGLDRYRKNTEYRKKRLPDTLHGSYDSIFLLLDQLETAAAPLLSLLSEEKHSTTHYLTTLINSLSLLGVIGSFEEDSAGKRILEELEKMQLAANTNDIQLNWTGFRTWLGRALEHSNFRPTNNHSSVLMMSVVQSNLHFFDGLILGAVEQAFLPGTANASPFFNDNVRRELNLEPSLKKQSLLKYHFRRLLQSAPTILVTYRQQHNNEDIIASPWIELIQTFNLLAYGKRLTSPMLEKLIHNEDAQVMLCDSNELPTPVDQPRIVIPPGLIPNSVSASTHQQLIDCPYQYYARQCLKLAPTEEIREALQKSDYGHRVHRSLEAFHGHVADLPGPFKGKLDATSRLEAIKLLDEISNAVFAKDLEDNFQHRGWLKKWLAIIPAYIDWQIKREQNWQVKHVEINQTDKNYAAGITLKGQLDRIDDNQQAYSIIDYKTGPPPKQQEIDSGEAIQLPFYALLADKLTDHNSQKPSQKTIERVEYLYLDKNKSISKASLESDHLVEIRDKLSKRLTLLMNNLAEGVAAPAWVDQTTCGRCTMEGLCRKTVWENNVENNMGNKDQDRKEIPQHLAD